VVEVGREEEKEGCKRRGEEDGSPAKPPKTAIFKPNCQLWGSCNHPPSPIWAKFSTQVQAHGVLLHAKFHRDRHILLYITTHNHVNITDFGNFGGSCTHIHRPTWVLIWHARVDPWYTLTCRISSHSVYSVTLKGQKFFLPSLQLHHSAVALQSMAETRLNAGAQLQAFPFPMTRRSFPHSNALMAKSSSQTLSFNSVTDKKNIKLFRPPPSGG